MSLTKQSTQYDQISKDKKEHFTYLDFSRFNFDDNGFSTEILSSNSRHDDSMYDYELDLVPGNFSTGSISRSQKPEIELSDSKLTNNPEEIAEIKKQLNETNKKLEKSILEMKNVKKYGAIFEWAKNYIEHSKYHDQTDLNI